MKKYRRVELHVFFKKKDFFDRPLITEILIFLIRVLICNQSSFVFI